MTFSQTTMKIFSSSILKTAFESAQLEGFTGTLTEFNDLAGEQFSGEWAARDKAAADHFNY